MGYRKEKIEAQIKRVISEVLIKEIKDPRIGFVSITDVSLSRDYSVARVGISILGESSDIRKNFDGVKSARGFLQHKVAKSIRMKTAPHIEFYLDPSVAEGVRMVQLLNDLEAEEQKVADERPDENGSIEETE